MKNKISQERKKYLKKEKTKKLLVIATQLAILIGFLAIWEALANAKIIDSFITSQPSRIWNTFAHLTTNDLLKHIKVTVYETIVGFGLGTLMGVAIAIILWWSKFLAKVSEPFLVVLNSLPKVALGPIIIIWVGSGTPAIIVMAIAIATVVWWQHYLSRFEVRDLKEAIIKLFKVLDIKKEKRDPYLDEYK